MNRDSSDLLSSLREILRHFSADYRNERRQTVHRHVHKPLAVTDAHHVGSDQQRENNAHHRDVHHPHHGERAGPVRKKFPDCLFYFALTSNCDQ